MNLFIHWMIYNLVSSILIYGSLAYNPRMWLHRMPPEVLQKVSSKSPQEKQLFVKIALPFLLWLFGYPIVYAFQKNVDLLSSFITLSIFFAGFALWDTLILDLLIFCKLTPRFIIIAGTRREDYSNMKYHLMSGAKGLILSIVFSGILAAILTLRKNLTG